MEERRPNDSLFRPVRHRSPDGAVVFRRVTPRFNNATGVTLDLPSELGDVLLGVYVTLPMRRTGVSYYPMERVIKTAVLTVGGVAVAGYDTEYARLHDEVFRKTDSRMAYREMTDFTSQPVGATKKLLVPLLFDPFVSRVGLPLAALQYTEVAITLDLELVVPGVSFDVRDLECFAEVEVVDGPERMRLATTPHKIQFKQVQMFETQVDPSDVEQKTTPLIQLPFSNPISSVLFALCGAKHGVYASNDLGLENDEVYGPVSQARLLMDNVDAIEYRDAVSLRLLEGLRGLAQAPSVGIYAIHFAERPDASVPTGTVNASRVKLDLQLVLKKMVDVIDDPETQTRRHSLRRLKVYALSWNALIVKDGLGGLAFL